MDKITKALNKLSETEKITVQQVLTLLKAGKIETLDIKKLKGYQNIFRARKGKVRIIYRVLSASNVTLLAIERRSDNTYTRLS